MGSAKSKNKRNSDQIVSKTDSKTLKKQKYKTMFSQYSNLEKPENLENETSNQVSFFVFFKFSNFRD